MRWSNWLVIPCVVVGVGIGAILGFVTPLVISMVGHPAPQAPIAAVFYWAPRGATYGAVFGLVFWIIGRIKRGS